MRTHSSRLSDTQTVQQCANKLAKRGKEDRGKEKMHKRVRKKCNFSIQYSNIYIFLLLFPSYAIERRRETTTFESTKKKYEYTASVKKNS